MQTKEIEDGRTGNEQVESPRSSDAGFLARRGRALLQLVGATKRQVRSMACWEAGLIVAIGLGVGLAIAATALLPLSHALTGSLRPHVPAVPFAGILGISALLALLALALPTRRAVRTRPVEAIEVSE